MLPSNEAHFKLLASTAGRLLAADEPEAAIDSLCREVMEHLDCQMFFNFLVGPRGDLQLNACAGIPEPEVRRIERLDASGTVCGQAAKQRCRIIAEGVQDSLEPEAALIRSYGVQAYCCHPLMAHGQLLGTLSFGTKTRKQFRPEEVDLMRAVTDQVATTMERSRALALNAVNSQLVEMNRRKDEFLATLAHELRNPLAAMGSALDVQKLCNGEGPAAEQAGRIVDRQFRHLVRLVDDLLDVSRITQGKIELRKERMDLGAAVVHAAEAVRSTVEAADLTLSVERPAEGVWIEADPVRIAEVVTNLLSNAAKFTRPGGRIAARVVERQDLAVVTVRDTGMGITPELLPHVFEIFTQGPQEPGLRGGLGIGLTLARSLIRMHGGTIDVCSEGVERGAEFTFRLPLAAPCEPAVTPARDAEASPGGAPLRILVVDDNRDAADSLLDLLRLLGADAQAAYGGAAAVEMLDRQRYAAVLLDIGMPGMDGYTVAQRVREAHGEDGPTLVAVTGWGQDADRRRAYAAGFDHHLVKPVKLSTLETLFDRLAR